MRFSVFSLTLVALLSLAGCEAPVAIHEEEVPLRFYRWTPGGEVPPEVLPGPPLRVQVSLYRQGAEASAHLRAQGGLPAEGEAVLFLEGAGGERVAEGYSNGKPFVSVRGRAGPPACVWWAVVFSPDPWRQEDAEARLYQAHGRVCEGER